MKRLALIVISLALTMTWAAAQDVAEKESRRDRLEREIAILEGQLKATAGQKAGAMTNLGLLQQKIATRRKLLARSERELRVLNDSLVATQRRINAIDARLDTMTFYYNRLVRNAYRNRDPRIWFMYLFSSSDLGQVSRRYSYMKGLSSSMNAQAVKIKESRAELEVQKAELAKTRAAAKKLRDERASELAKLQKEEKQSQTLITRLKKNQNTYQKQLNAKRRQVEALNKEIQKLISSSMSASRKSKNVDVKLSGEFSANKGRLPWPADGPVVEKFGRNPHPVYKKVTMPFNNGIGIAVSPGTDAKAVFDGVVTQVIVMPGYNKCVLVQHGEYFTFYCKLASVSVKPGQKITTGQSLGRIDTLSGETQLHFEIWKERSVQNPEVWLR